MAAFGKPFIKSGGTKEAAQYFRSQGPRGQAIRQAIDNYNAFARTLEQRNKMRAAQGHSYLKYDPFNGQGRILSALAHLESASQAQLARSLDVTPQTVSVAIRKLENDGLVERLPAPDDARMRRVSLTEAGKAEICRLEEQSSYSGSVFESLEDEELGAFAQMMLKMTKHLEHEMSLTAALESAAMVDDGPNAFPSLTPPQR